MSSTKIYDVELISEDRARSSADNAAGGGATPGSISATPPAHVPLSYRAEGLVIDLFILHFVAMIAILASAIVRAQPFVTYMAPVLIYISVIILYFAAFLGFAGASPGMALYRVRVTPGSSHMPAERRRLIRGICYVGSLGFAGKFVSSEPISAVRRNLAAAAALVAFLLLCDVLLSWLA